MCQLQCIVSLFNPLTTKITCKLSVKGATGIFLLHKSLCEINWKVKQFPVVCSYGKLLHRLWTIAIHFISTLHKCRCVCLNNVILTRPQSDMGENWSTFRSNSFPGRNCTSNKENILTNYWSERFSWSFMKLILRFESHC